MWTSLLHAGLAGSFMRFPHVPPRTEALRESSAGAAIYGIPFDATNISRTGANYGPRGIRDVSVQFLTYNATLDFDLGDALSPVDCGDCDVIPGDPTRTFERAQADLEQIIRAGALPVTLGGEHSVTIPAVRAVRSVHSNPGLILVDTHLDTAPDVGGELLSHCCPITRAVDAGFDPTKIALVGISGWMNPRTELRYCHEHGITVIWLEDIWREGIASVVDRTLEVVRDGTDGVYLSFDVDSLDAAHAPGTCCPTPGGLTSREAI
jgi:agmatinase/guanidinobutyrase